MPAVKTIDATVLKQKTARTLGNAIYECVKDTQRFLITDLPNEVLVTKRQFKMLGYDPTKPKNQLLLTPMNCMEVKVVDNE